MIIHTRGCADELQASRQGWLDHLARINAALGLAQVKQSI